MPDDVKTVDGSDTLTEGAEELARLSDAEDALVESLFGPDDDDVTDGDQTEQDAETATEAEPTDDGNGETADEESVVEGATEDVDDSTEKQPDFYSQDELDKLPIEHVDIDKVDPGVREAYRKLKQKAIAADEKFRKAAETRRENEENAKVLQELKKAIDEQNKLNREQWQHNRDAERKKELEAKYRRIEETEGEDAARLERRLDAIAERQQPEPQKDARYEQLQQEVEMLKRERAQMQIKEGITSAMRSAGLDPDDDTAFTDVHREALAIWHDEQGRGAKQWTPIEEIAKAVKGRYDKRFSNDSALDRVKSTPELKEQLRKEILDELKAEYEKKKKAKTVIPGGGGQISPKPENESFPDGISDVRDVFSEDDLDAMIGRFSGTK